MAQNQSARRTTRRRGAGRLVAGVALAAGAACGDGAPSRPAARAGDHAPGPRAADTLVARLGEWRIDLSRPVVGAGPVVLSVVNQGHLQHAVVVEGEGVQRISDHVAPGGTAALRLELRPGRYAVYCPVKEGGDHDRLGMRTILVVEPPPG